MKLVATPLRTSILIALSAILVVFTTGFANPDGMVIPTQRPAGPLSSDGTPYEEPELNPHVPDVPKHPGTVLVGSEQMALASAESRAENANLGWMLRLAAFYLYRVRF
ncbi:MAG: hypothetical protein R3E97_00345 [Candidatus Eisenbacteria bacterium]